MKFILNEKYILAEKFILTEAIDETRTLESIKQVKLNFSTKPYTIATIDKMLAELDALLKNFDAAKEILDALNKALDSTVNKQDSDVFELSPYKKLVNDYLDQVDTLLQPNNLKRFTWVSTQLSNAIVNGIARLRKLAGDGPESVEYELNSKTQAGTDTDDKTKKEGRKRLKNVLTKLNQNISNALLGNSEDIDATKKALQKLKEINIICITEDNVDPADKAFLDKVVDAIKKISDDRRQSYYDILQQQWLMNVLQINEKKFLLPITLKNIKDILAATNDTNTGSENAIEALRKLMNEDADLTSIDSDESIDWLTLLKTADSQGTVYFEKENKNLNKQQVWNKYYEIEWPGIDQNKFEALGNAFIEELYQIGFNIAKNPFIAFLQAMIKNVDFNIKTYGAIHNAYIRGYITAADLRSGNAAPSGEQLGKNNIIFNPNLYTRDGATIEQLIYIQKQAIGVVKGGKFKIEALKNTYTTAADFVTDLFTKDGNPLKLIHGKVGNDLWTLNEIEQRFARCSDDSLQQAVAKTAFTLTNAIKLKINSKNVGKAINYILLSNPETHTDADVIKWAGTYNFKPADVPSADKMSEFTTLFKDFDIKKDTIEDIIKQLAEFTGIYKAATTAGTAGATA